MKFQPLHLIIGTLVLAAVALLSYRSAAPTTNLPVATASSSTIPSKPSPAQASPAVANAPASRPIQATPPPSPASSVAAAPTTLEGISEAITLAASSYDPAQLPRIEPFLRHPDPAVRAAALNGIVNLGHADGAKFLRQAASQTRDASEAAKLLEKAAWLELPPVPQEKLLERIRAAKALKAKGAAPAAKP